MPSPRANNKQSPQNEGGEMLVRITKAANYGKWYLQPKFYNKKIDILNKKIKDTIEHSSY